MTQIITRYFEDAAKATEAKSELIKIYRFAPRIIDIFDSAEGLEAKLSESHVAEATAKAYSERVAKGGAVMLVRAAARPLMAAKKTRDVTAEFGAPAIDGLDEEVYVKDPIELGRSILTTHPLLMTSHREPGSDNYHMANWPIPLISRRKPSSTSLMPAGTFMANFPIPHIDRREPFTASIFPRHARMANFPIPLISKRVPKDRFAFPRHARMANFPIPLISKRVPKDRFIIPRHGRMATVPFPLLINGKTGVHALIPGAPRMANFPIPLLSQRKPKDKFAFPRHARMANFPIPLISKRKPKDRFVIPRHGRMANMFLPLVTRREEDGGKGFSFSKYIGLKTISRR